MNGSTKIYGILGHPIKHTLSPLLHNFAFEFFKQNKIYIPFDISNFNYDYKSFFNSINVCGLSVTIPYKLEAKKIGDRCDIISNLSGASNTLINKNNLWYAYNTDGYGALTALKKVKNLDTSNILILGNGGAALGLAISLLTSFPKIRVKVTGRNFENVKKFVEDIKNSLKKYNGNEPVENQTSVDTTTKFQKSEENADTTIVSQENNQNIDTTVKHQKSEQNADATIVSQENNQNADATIVSQENNQNIDTTVKHQKSEQNADATISSNLAINNNLNLTDTSIDNFANESPANLAPTNTSKMPEKSNSESSALKAKNEINIEAVKIENIESNNINVIINCTPVGLKSYANSDTPEVSHINSKNNNKSDKSDINTFLPINENLIKKHHYVFDMIYNPKFTPLLKVAKAKGAQIIFGYEMFLHQAIKQMELFCEEVIPDKLIKKVEKLLLKELGKK